MRSLILTLTLLLAACGGGGSSDASQPASNKPIEMLWNPGPSYAADIEQGMNYGACDVPALADMSEAALVGNGQLTTSIDCAGVIANPGNYAPSYFVNTIWEPERYKASPGYNAEKLSGGHGVPIVTRITNDAAADAPCTLREVSVSYIPWRNLQQWPGFTNLEPQQNNTVFRDQYDILKFQSITATATAKLDYSSGHSTCAAFPKNVYEYDAAVQYFDVNGSLLRTDILGVTMYNEGNLHAAGTNILYSSACPVSTVKNPLVCQIAVAGSMIGYPELNGEWQSYSFELVSLFKTYFPKPPDGTVKSVLMDAESYSSVMGASNIVEVTNMDLKGVPL